jgi:hypothetical protein
MSPHRHLQWIKSPPCASGNQPNPTQLITYRWMRWVGFLAREAGFLSIASGDVEAYSTSTGLETHQKSCLHGITNIPCWRLRTDRWMDMEVKPRVFGQHIFCCIEVRNKAESG